MRDNFSDYLIMRRKPKQGPETPKVTIAIGFISKRSRWSEGEIIFACDSQTSYSKDKDLDAQKLFPVKFKNGRALFAHAGYVKPALRALDLIRERAKDALIENASQTIRAAMLETKSELLSGHQLTDQQREDYLKSNFFEFLIGYYIGGKPFLLHTDIPYCNVYPVENATFAAIGEGDYLARYLLKEYQAADPGFELSDLIAMSVIEKVKANVNGCGGPTRIGLSFAIKDNPWECDIFLYEQYLVDESVDDLRKYEALISAERKARLETLVHEFWAKRGIVTYGRISPDNPLIKPDSGPPSSAS